MRALTHATISVRKERREFVRIATSEAFGEKSLHFRDAWVADLLWIPHGVELALVAGAPTAAPVGHVHLAVVAKVDIGRQHVLDERMLIDDFESRADWFHREREHARVTIAAEEVAEKEVILVAIGKSEARIEDET